jgi:hypothetical protein
MGQFVSHALFDDAYTFRDSTISPTMLAGILMLPNHAPVARTT